MDAATGERLKQECLKQEFSSLRSSSGIVPFADITVAFQQILIRAQDVPQVRIAGAMAAVQALVAAMLGAQPQRGACRPRAGADAALNR